MYADAHLSIKKFDDSLVIYSYGVRDLTTAWYKASEGAP
jgi:hypothetical protein